MSIRARWLRFAPVGALVAVIGTGGLPCHWAGAPAAHAQGAIPPESQGQGQAQTAEIRVTLTEWALTPARINVPVERTIRFLAVNAGVLPHALTVEGTGIFAETETLGAGQTGTLDVRFTAAGIYDIYCPVNAGQHRELGQEGVLVVLAAGDSPATLLLPKTGDPEVASLPSELPAPDA